MLEKYAELIIKQGVNLQVGQELLIDASIDSYQLVRLLTKKAYEVGAKDVIVNYRDEEVSRLRYEYCHQEHFEIVPLYIQELRNQYAARHAPIKCRRVINAF